MASPLTAAEEFEKDKKFKEDLQNYYRENKYFDNIFLEQIQTRRKNFDETDAELMKEVNNEENDGARAKARANLIENYFIDQQKFKSFQETVSNTIKNTLAYRSKDITDEDGNIITPALREDDRRPIKSINNMLKYIGNEEGRLYWDYLEMPTVKKGNLKDKIIGKPDSTEDANGGKVKGVNDDISSYIKESSEQIGGFLEERRQEKAKKKGTFSTDDTDAQKEDQPSLPEASTEDSKGAEGSTFNNKYSSLSTEEITKAIKTMSADYDEKLLKRQDDLDNACRKELSELYTQAGRLTVQLDPVDNSNDNKNQDQSKKYLVSLNAIVQSTIAARQKAAASKRPPIPLTRPPIQSNAGPKEQNNNAQTPSPTPENAQAGAATPTPLLLTAPPESAQAGTATPTPLLLTAPPTINTQTENAIPPASTLSTRPTSPMPTTAPPTINAQTVNATPPSAALPAAPDNTQTVNATPPASTLPTRPNPQMPTKPPPALNQPATKQPRPPMPLPSEIQAAKDKLANEFRKRSEERAAASIAPTKEEKSILDFSWKKFSPSTKADFEAAKAKIIEKYCKQLEIDYRKLKIEFRNEQMDAFTALRGKKRFERKEAEEFRTSKKNISEAETSQYNFDIAIDQFFKEVMRKIIPPPPKNKPNLAPRAAKKEEMLAITGGTESNNENENEETKDGQVEPSPAPEANENVNKHTEYTKGHVFRDILRGKMYQTNFLEKAGESLLYLYQQMDNEQPGKDKTDSMLSSIGKKAKSLWSKVKNKLGGKKEGNATKEKTKGERESGDGPVKDQVDGSPVENLDGNGTAENKEPKDYNVSGNRECFSKDDLRNIIVSSQPTQDSNLFNLRLVYQKEFIEDRSKQDGMDVNEVTKNYFKGAYGKESYKKSDSSAGAEKIYNYTRALLRAYIVLKSGARAKPTGVPAEQTSTINQCSEIDTYRKFVKTIGQQIGRQNNNTLIETCKKYLKDFMKKCESELSGKDKDKSNYYEYLKECFDDVIGNRELPKKTLQNALKNVLDSETGIKNMIKEETWLFAGEATSEMNIEASNANKSVKGSKQNKLDKE